MSGRTAGGILSIFQTAIDIAPTATRAASVWNETSNGDLSNNGGAPSNVALSLGSNTITGTVDGGDRDIVHISIPAGAALQKLVLDAYASGDATAFIAMQAGSTYVGDPNSGTGMLGYSHFGTGGVGSDILDDIGFNGDGFTPPLTGGDYTFWVQQLGSTTGYTFDFQVVPEPGAVALLALAGVALIGRARRT